MAKLAGIVEVAREVWGASEPATADNLPQH